MAKDTSQDSKRISQLEAQLAAQKQDLDRYRQELVDANTQLKRITTRLQGELDMIHQIQKALVPTEFPHIPGFDFSTRFIASARMGGDYYDIFEHEDRMHFGVILSSASDHSTSSLLLGVLLKLTGQIEGRKSTDPAQWMSKISEEILPQVNAQASWDLFCGIFDRRQFEFSFSGTGKMAVLLQAYGSDEIQPLHTETRALNSDPKPKLEKRTVSLGPRDRLVFCSRGVVDAKNSSGESFGWERLFKAIKEAPDKGVHEVRNNILFEVQRFSGGEEGLPHRDQSVIAIEVKDRVIRLATKQ